MALVPSIDSQPRLATSGYAHVPDVDDAVHNDDDDHTTETSVNPLDFARAAIAAAIFIMESTHAAELTAVEGALSLTEPAEWLRAGMRMYRDCTTTGAVFESSEAAEQLLESRSMLEHACYALSFYYQRELDNAVSVDDTRHAEMHIWSIRGFLGVLAPLPLAEEQDR